MIIPNYDNMQMVDKDGNPTSGFSNFMQTLLKGMTASISDEGYLIPPITSEPNSAGPGLTQLGVLQASFQSNVVNPNSQTVTVGVQIGTIIFDPYELNGGAVGPPRVPKGQLKVLLNDGTFHPITNT